MSILTKIFMIFLMSVMAFKHMDYGNIICVSIAVLSCLYLFSSLSRVYKDFSKYSEGYYKGEKNFGNSSHINYNRYYGLCGVNKTYNINESDFSYLNSYTTSEISKPKIIKNIEATMNLKEKNFVEFIGDKKICEYTSKLNKKFAEPKKKAKETVSKFSGSNVLMIKNEETVDGVDKLVYDAIIEVLDKKQLTPNERYALLQSFYYVDTMPLIIVIYIDNFILEKAHLSESDLSKDEITENIKKKLKSEHIVIEFTDLKAVNLLNYYLSK